MSNNEYKSSDSSDGFEILEKMLTNWVEPLRKRRKLNVNEVDKLQEKYFESHLSPLVAAYQPTNISVKMIHYSCQQPNISLNHQPEHPRLNIHPQATQAGRQYN
ncbi:hypothetical protein DFJ58DRAFT_845901 [Suillus subalutaceus]|uniref:uncharacterized protein n=1 Tax=Suillus subalutaceus TaxID=48586 RepID=UPI001B877B87|nr:uncharacterized protein DFJ58DRAFT_845901 [Suillus subalutaceus]KAG1838859.1 hypothetical protein DFJ58DRAFT_845901 [Suillus subalutaceus]